MSVSEKAIPKKDILKDFANETTLHGLPKVITSSNACKRTVWCVLFFTGLVVMGWQTSKLFEQYLSFRKAVSVDVDQTVMPFPGVTLCSEGQTMLSVKEEIADHVKGYNVKDVFNMSHNIFVNLTVDDYTRISNNSGPESIVSREYLKWFSNSIKSMISFFYENYKLDGYLLSANLGFNVSTHAGIRLEDVLYVCEFDGQPCTFANFTVYRDPRYILCYTFRTASLATVGRTRGLKLILKYTPLSEKLLSINTFPGLNSVDFSPGFKVAVHPQESDPVIEEGVTVYPGLKTALGFTRTIYNRIGQPHGNCTNRVTLADNETPYSSIGCSNEYKQELVHSLCNCTDIALPFQEHELERYPYCRKLVLPSECNHNASFWRGVSALKPETFSLIPDKCNGPVAQLFRNIHCISNATFVAYTRMNHRNLSSQCFPPCSETKFEVRDHSGVWPTTDDYYHNLGLIITQNEKRLKEMIYYSYEWTYRETGSQRPLDDFRKKFLQVNVYQRDADVTTIREQAMYEWYQLLSELGGLVGLYVGMSIMTVCELFEFILVKLFSKLLPKKLFAGSDIHVLKT